MLLLEAVCHGDSQARGRGAVLCASSYSLQAYYCAIAKKKKVSPPPRAPKTRTSGCTRIGGGEWVQPRGVMLTAPLHSPLLSRHSGALRVQILLAMSRMDLAKYALYL